MGEGSERMGDASSRTEATLRNPTRSKSRTRGLPTRIVVVVFGILIAVLITYVLVQTYVPSQPLLPEPPVVGEGEYLYPPVEYVKNVGDLFLLDNVERIQPSESSRGWGRIRASPEFIDGAQGPFDPYLCSYNFVAWGFADRVNVSCPLVAGAYVMRFERSAGEDPRYVPALSEMIREARELSGAHVLWAPDNETRDAYLQMYSLYRDEVLRPAAPERINVQSPFLFDPAYAEPHELIYERRIVNGTDIEPWYITNLVIVKDYVIFHYVEYSQDPVEQYYLSRVLEDVHYQHVYLESNNRIDDHVTIHYYKETPSS